MSSKNRKIKSINSQLDVIRQAQIDELEKVGREIEKHLDKMADAMIRSFWIEHEDELKSKGLAMSDLDIRNTNYWKIDIVKHYTDLSINLIVRDKMSLNDILAKYIPKVLANDTSPVKI